MLRFDRAGASRAVVVGLFTVIVMCFLIFLHMGALVASDSDRPYSNSSLRSTTNFKTADLASPRLGASGLPLPRFVSLKSDRVNVRLGPSREHRTKWVYARAGFPLEIIQEYDNWRRVRDIRGNDGWVYHSLLSGRRTVQVGDWQGGLHIDLRDGAQDEATVLARLQPGVLATLRRCTSGWCKLDVQGHVGWVKQNLLWGVYPNEDY